jgi:hypothetical protein
MIKGLELMDLAHEAGRFFVSTINSCAPKQNEGGWTLNPQLSTDYCLSYLPLSTFLSTLNPAFFARAISFPFSELNVEKILRTGLRHAGQFVSGVAESGRFNVNFPPQTLQSPSHSSYS